MDEWPEFTWSRSKVAEFSHWKLKLELAESRLMPADRHYWPRPERENEMDEMCGMNRMEFSSIRQALHTRRLLNLHTTWVDLQLSFDTFDTLDPLWLGSIINVKVHTRVTGRN